MLQIAADKLVTGEDQRDLAAMGYLTLGPRFLQNIHDIIDDRLDTLGRGMMALTISCARCHDHKFDPIPTKDTTRSTASSRAPRKSSCRASRSRRARRATRSPPS